MGDQFYVNILTFYGLFLITCGIVSVTFIGARAKTALISGGGSGGAALLIAYLIYNDFSSAKFAGIFLSLALIIVFSWRSTKTLFRLFEIIPEKHEDLKGKGIAFLIISLMAVVSVVIFILQTVFLNI